MMDWHRLFGLSLVDYFHDLPVTVEVKDRAGQVVVRAVITMWVTPRKKP